MDLGLKLEVGWKLVQARRHDRWTRERLEAWRDRRLRQLLHFAASHSPAHRERLKGLVDAPLSELPVLTKAEINARWDDLVTDRTLKLADARHFIEHDYAPDKLLRGHYHVMATSGTTGVRAVFAYNEAEWRQVTATVGRLKAWRGGVGPSKRRRLAMVAAGRSAGAPMAQRCSVTMMRLFPDTVFVDSSLPVAEQVRLLNEVQPKVLSSYASSLSLLAEEQAAGRLRVQQIAINSNSEVLSPAARARAREVFGTPVHESYGITEAGMAAGTCVRADGMHLQEDTVILESVDEQGREVPSGSFGARVLLTVLWSRTLPLIRYEISDRVRFTESPCPCGLPYRLIAEIDGRAGDVLVLPGRAGGEVRVAPSQIHAWLRPWPIVHWQMARRGDALHLRVVPRTDGLDRDALRAALTDRFAQAGAATVTLRIETVDSIPLAASGKLTRLLTETGPAVDAVDRSTAA